MSVANAEIKSAPRLLRKIIIKESKQTIHYIYFLFSRCYVQITLLI